MSLTKYKMSGLADKHKAQEEAELKSVKVEKKKSKKPKMGKLKTNLKKKKR